jgi:2-oxoglutarate dehydrogenase E2 component (dihydrolipoamide succinyltransferase)
MGESITQGVLAKWHVAAGSYVKADEVVASIETDKVRKVPTSLTHALHTS